MTTIEETFIAEVLGDAHAAASHLGIPVSPVLAQWCNETGFGTSDAWRNGHNYAGVSFLEPFQEGLGAHLGDQGEILFYPDRAAGLAGYIGRWADQVYTDTRASWAAHVHDAYQVAQDIEMSPWAGGHYGGDGLKKLMINFNLTQYDGQPAPVPSPDPQSVPCGALTPGAPPAGHRLLKVGTNGPDVAELQLALAIAGRAPLNSFDKGVPDGIFGSETAQAVADFQSDHGLHRDGIVGRQTWCALGHR